MLSIFIFQEYEARVTGCVMILEGFLEILATLMWKNISVCDDVMPNSLLKPRFHQAVQIGTARNILERYANTRLNGDMSILLHRWLRSVLSVQPGSSNHLTFTRCLCPTQPLTFTLFLWLETNVPNSKDPVSGVIRANDMPEWVAALGVKPSLVYWPNI